MRLKFIHNLCVCVVVAINFRHIPMGLREFLHLNSLNKSPNKISLIEAQRSSSLEMMCHVLMLIQSLAEVGGVSSSKETQDTVTKRKGEWRLGGH